MTFFCVSRMPTFVSAGGVYYRVWFLWKCALLAVMCCCCYLTPSLGTAHVGGRVKCKLLGIGRWPKTKNSWAHTKLQQAVNLLRTSRLASPTAPLW